MRQRFKPTLMMALGGLAILLGLGFWQLGRIPQKEAEIARIDAYIGDAPMELPETLSPEADEYRPVEVSGVIEDDELHVLVSTRDYGAGFRIIAAFTMDNGRRIMIDRGYVTAEFKDGARVLGPRTIIGNLHWPDERDGWIPEDDTVNNYWYARDVGKMAAALGTEPVLVVAREDAGVGILPMPVTTENIPNNHFSYAVQWFLFAAVWVGMTSVLLWRIRSGTDQEN